MIFDGLSAPSAEAAELRKGILMSAEEKSIHEFDYSLICEYFAGLERQGPGGADVTIRALDFVDGLNDSSRIADIGCGTGGQTMVLAGHAPGCVTGIDLFADFIDIFNAKAAKAGLAERVRGIVGNMEDLPFAEGELDLIWSEGAIYNIGFERGVNEWRRFLKPGGYLAVTEASWFTETRPEEIDSFWKREYPGIDTIAAKIGQMQLAGYVPVASFVLPEHCWIENFYAPQTARQERFLEEHSGDPLATELVENQRHEAELYQKYKDYYGYVFYIGRRI
jgi:SAM-dependent methyltransferase